MAWTESSSEDRVSFSYDGPGREVVEVSYARGGQLASFVVFGILVVLSVSLARFNLLIAVGADDALLRGHGVVLAPDRACSTKRASEDHFVVTISSSAIVSRASKE